jgi:hypothetical protein
MAVIETAVTALERGAEAEVELLRITWRAGGARVVERRALGAVEVAAPTLIQTLVRDVLGDHAAIKEIFALTEQHFLTVITSPTSAKSAQARLAMDALHDAWETQRRALQELAKQQGKGATERLPDILKRLDDHFNSRFGFVSWTSQVPYEDSEKFAKVVRAKLGTTTTPSELFDELADVTKALPFLKHPPTAAAAAAKRGRELLKEMRQALAKAGLEEQAAALSRLERFCAEGDVVYDEVAHIVEAQVASYRESGKALDSEFVKDTANKVQGRIAEALALRSPEFQRRVWKPLQRSAEVLRDRLNAALGSVPDAQLWRVEVITEPALATTLSGAKGQLSDAGVWLIRDSDATAMPIFILEVKSGELRGSIVQQVLDRERLTGGLIDLPTTGRRYRLAPPPDQEVQYALATTREVTDARMLGLRKGDRGPPGRLRPFDEVLQFPLPMDHQDIKHASVAAVQAQLKLR